jgi:tetratricopeptide (TPR) repeat protein
MLTPLFWRGAGGEAFAQNKKLDSLTKIYNDKTQPDTNRLKARHKIANIYLYNNPDTAIVLAKQELALAQQSKQKKFEANALNIIGVCYMNKGNYPEALKNHFASLKIREEIKDKKGIAASYNNIGLIYYYQGNYPEALKNYFASLKIQEEIKDKQGIAYSCNNIGIIYIKQGNYPEALKNHFGSLKISIRATT